MDQDYSKLGVFNVDGQWATRIRYDVSHSAGSIDEVRLQFLNGRHEVAAAVLTADGAREVLGEQNFATMRKAVERKAKQTPEPVSGDLRGQQLAYRQVALDKDQPNSIEARSRQLATAPEEEAPLRDDPQPTSGAAPVPSWVKDRFLVVDNRYHFPDHALAFTDHGNKLTAKTDNAEVARSLVAIAEARKWQALKVRGSEAFRRQVWREASRRSIEVDGYNPTALEIAEVQQAPIGRKATEPTGTAAPPQATSGSDAEKPDRPPKNAPSARPDVLIGRLLNSGAAPYQFNPTASMSYYVKVSTDAGERTIWGVDLERAMAESSTQPKIGDTVGIENQGSRPVTFKSQQRHADGTATETMVTANRQHWLIEKDGYFEERAERAAAFANGQATKRELAQQHPDLSGALVSLWVGEQFAAKMIERPQDRERVIALVKERLRQALERGESIDAPKLKQEVGQKLATVGDDGEEIAHRARARAARRAPRTADDGQPGTAPRVLA